MNQKRLVKTSKLLSLVLRHKPQVIDIVLDEHGWTDVATLLRQICARRYHVSRAELDEVVATNDKKRFAFSEDGTRIRASQGHSLGVDLLLEPQEPPPRLYHGTATRFLDSITRDGLEPHGRQHVHLSADASTAAVVGRRHGKLVVLTIDTEAMHHDGHEFYLSANGVWLTATVPWKYVVDSTFREEEKKP